MYSKKYLIRQFKNCKEGRTAEGKTTPGFWYFMTHYVKTLDSKKSKVESFPDYE